MGEVLHMFRSVCTGRIQEYAAQKPPGTLTADQNRSQGPAGLHSARMSVMDIYLFNIGNTGARGISIPLHFQGCSVQTEIPHKVAGLFLF